MYQNNSSSNKQENIEPTQNFLSQNLLRQQASQIEQFQNQEEFSNMQNKQDDASITFTSENSIKKKVKSLIKRGHNSQKKISGNYVCQVINQNQDQHAMLSNKDQVINQLHLSSRNQNSQQQHQKASQQDKIFQSNIDSQEEDQSKQDNNMFVQDFQNFSNPCQFNFNNYTNNSSQQKDQQQSQSQYPLNLDQKSVYQQKNMMKRTIVNENDSLQNDFHNSEAQNKYKQEISQQINEFKVQNTEREINNSQQLDHLINDEQKIIQQSDKIKQQSILILDSQKIKKIFDLIEEFQFNEFENKIELEKSGFQVQKLWKQEIFDRVNCKEIQSEIFQSQKQIIFERLKQEQYYLCKIIHTNSKEDLVLGFSVDEENQFDDYVFKIIQSQAQTNIDSQYMILKTLGYQIDHIKLELQNISILVLKKIDYLQIQSQLKYLVQFKSNIKQIENLYEINSQNCQKCTECRDQITCQKMDCYNNIKSRILTFLKSQKQLYCEYQNKQIEGVIFQLNQEELISEYLNFAQKTIFSFLENIQIEKENVFQLQSNKLTENICEQQQDFQQEENNKQMSNIDLLNEYTFNELQRESVQAQEKGNQNTNCLREWSINKFNDLNTNILSDKFQKQKMDIIQTLKTKQYFLCKCFVINDSEDIFLGYQEEIQDKYKDYIFVIKNNPNDSEIQKYYCIMNFNEELNHFIINDYIHVIILQKDAFLQIYNNYEYVSQNKIEWTKDYFEQINKDKDINLKECNQCDGCKKECQEHHNFRNFQDQKNEIFEKLIQKNYYICEYLNRGGQGVVFQGYRQIFQDKQEFVFKILFGCNLNQLKREIQIMKMFDCHVCVIKFIENIQINDKTHILILEKCKFSLMDELEQLKKENIFPLEKLLQMIFNLLDGLIQFRIYNILHLDIKPQNILLNNQDLYVYTDFGMSSTMDRQDNIGFTKYYASPEQTNNKFIEYKSDVYSLGKTFQIIFKYFEAIQQIQNLKVKEKTIIFWLKEKVEQQMVQSQSTNRLNCLELRNLFFKYFLKQKECIQFFKQYVNHIQEILMSYPYDKNKEIPYYLQISLFYQHNILDFWQEFSKLNLQKNIQQTQQNVVLSLNKVSNCYQNLGDNKKALEYQFKSLNIIEQIFKKENHPYYATSLKNIGWCYSQLGNNKQALKYTLESLQMLQQMFKENHPDTAESLNNAGVFYQNLGDHKKALECYMESLQMRQQIFKQNHPDIAESFNNVGSCYEKLGDNKKALEYQLESLQILKQVYKENHPDIAVSLNNIGHCYENLGNNKKALEYLLESLQMRKQIFKENHPSIAESLNNVGYCFFSHGDNIKALEYYLKSLHMFRQIIKENHPNIAACLNNISMCYRNLGNYKKALECQLESFKMTKQIFKENHPDIALSLNNVGLCYKNLGDNTQALQFQLESLQIFQQIFKENHPLIAASLNNIGNCYQSLGDSKKALEYSLESLQMSKQIFKENHSHIATFLNSVGLCYQNLGDNQKALEYSLESLRMREQLFKENHQQTAASLNNVGLCYQNLGDNKKALKYQLEALKMTKYLFKENHPDIATSLNNIGLCYQNLGDNKKAVQYQLESLQIFQQIFKENHPDIAISLNNVGLCYLILGDIKMALEYLLEALQMSKQIFKQNHPSIALCLNNVGCCYQNLGDDKKAFDCQLESLLMNKQLFNENHPYIAASLNNVGSCYQNLGDNKKALGYLLESLLMKKQLFKQDHPQLAVTLNNVGSCYQNLYDNNKALEYQLQSLQILKQIFKENHPDIATSMINVGVCNQNLGDNKEALEYQLESLQMKK